MTSLHLLLPFPHWKIIISLFHPLSNEHIAIPHENKHLQNMHAKMCKYYLHYYLNKFSFWPVLSTPSSWTCVSSYGSDNSTLLVYLSGKNVKYRFARPTFPKQSNFFMVSTLRCQLFSTLLYWGGHTNIKQ